MRAVIRDPRTFPLTLNMFIQKKVGRVMAIGWVLEMSTRDTAPSD